MKKKPNHIQSETCCSTKRHFNFIYFEPMVFEIITKFKKKKEKKKLDSFYMAILFQQFKNHFVFTHLRCNTTDSFVNELKFIFENEIWFECLALIQFNWLNSNWMRMSIIFFFSFFGFMFTFDSVDPLSNISKIQKKTKNLFVMCLLFNLFLC